MSVNGPSASSASSAGSASSRSSSNQSDSSSSSGNSNAASDSNRSSGSSSASSSNQSNDSSNERSGSSTEDRLRDTPTQVDNLSTSETPTERATGNTNSDTPTETDAPRAGETRPVASQSNIEPLNALPDTANYGPPNLNTEVQTNQPQDDAVPAVVAGVVGSNNGVYARAEGLALSELDKHVGQVIDDGLGNKARVGAVVVDNTNFNVEVGVNTKKPPADLHPVLQNRVDNLDQQTRHPSRPGNHAEVNALNTAIQNREAATGKPFTEADLPSMTVASAWTKSSNSGGMVAGETAHQCANCTQITDGTNNLSGNATTPYTLPDDTPGTGTPPRYAFQNTDLASARRGGATGGLAAAGMSTVQALSDGQITSDELGQIATDTATGVVAGAGGEVIENVAGRAVESAASRGAASGLSQTTRVVGSRVAGAGAAGAVIGAGFATFDQVGAYQRGEVTASEAIGTVTAEAATGLAAGVSGAAAGAAIGSIIPGAGTVVGGVVGFGVGMAAGYLADKGLRAAGVTDAIASGVTSTIDAAADVAGAVSDGVSSAVDSVGGALSSAGEKLGSLFGW